MTAPFTDADAAELYDALNPWDGTRWPADRFYAELVMAATDVLDVGCGTGAMLQQAREAGHMGRLVGIDPDRSALDRARRRGDIEWVTGRAVDIDWRDQFDLAVMASHAFQCLIRDDESLASLEAIRRALRVGGQLVFETRHPQARAWETWESAGPRAVTSGSRPLLVEHRLDAVDGDVITFTETTRDADGAWLRSDCTQLRFPDAPRVNDLLAAAGFAVAAQYGDWDRGAITSYSTEIITVATPAATS
jgi:SAM-dependent methyltransferase